MTTAYPILYSFRRCPYAMRARMALLYAGITVTLREIDLKNKHDVFLQDSPKGTVPVLILLNNTIIDQSLDIVDYAFAQSHQHNHEIPYEIHALDQHPLYQQINTSFTKAVTRIKYHERYSEQEVTQARLSTHTFLKALEEQLINKDYLLTSHLGKLDVIIFPFVRQLYRSNDEAFMALPYPHIQRWMLKIIDSAIFQAAMIRAKAWQPDQNPIILRPPV